jgi:hypothetical protein
VVISYRRFGTDLEDGLSRKVINLMSAFLNSTEVFRFDKKTNCIGKSRGFLDSYCYKFVIKLMRFVCLLFWECGQWRSTMKSFIDLQIIWHQIILFLCLIVTYLDLSPQLFLMWRGKAVPLQAWSGPEGSRKLRFPDFMTTAQDGCKVVSLTHRPPLPQGNVAGTYFC